MKGTVAAWIGTIVLMGTAACATPGPSKPIELGPVATGSGTLASARQYLEGRWALVSYQIFPAGQPPIRVNGSGTLSYDAFSNLDMEIRVDAATAEMLDRAGIPSEQGVISVKGRTAVDMQARTLTYMLAGQPLLVASSGPLAPNRPRHWAVNGNILTLTTKAEDGRTLSEGRWQKSP